MIEYLIAGLAFAVLAAWVARPLFAPAPIRATEADERLIELVEEKQAIYRSILDLDLDLEVGKISPEDHLAFRSRYEAEAARILKKIDLLEEENLDTIEAEIAEARKRLGSQ